LGKKMGIAVHVFGGIRDYLFSASSRFKSWLAIMP
jgi:hypothetical protein